MKRELSPQTFLILHLLLTSAANEITSRRSKLEKLLASPPLRRASIRYTTTTNGEKNHDGLSKRADDGVKNSDIPSTHTGDARRRTSLSSYNKYVMSEIANWDEEHRKNNDMLKKEDCLSKFQSCEVDDDCCGSCIGLDKDSGYKYCLNDRGAGGNSLSGGYENKLSSDEDYVM